MTTKRNDSGFALVIVTIIMTVAIALVGSLTMRGIYSYRTSQAYVSFEKDIYGCEAGIADAAKELERVVDGIDNDGDGLADELDEFDGNIGTALWSPYDDTNGDGMPSFGEANVVPRVIGANTDSQTEYVAWTQMWGSDGVDNNGDGLVDEQFERDYVTITGLARRDEHVRMVEVVATNVNINCWTNAVFGGAGQAGGCINGNVSVHGSVHILGDNIPMGGAAVAAIDMSGTSLIRNNYVGMPPELADRIPPLDTRQFQGEDVKTLNTSVRVKRGLVSMSGTAQIGDPDMGGNDLKETVDGTYVTEGWTGNAVIPDGGRGDPTNVYSDNGWDEVYDLGTKLSFPRLSDPWRHPVTGVTQINPGTGLPYTHEEYFTQVLADSVIPGPVNIQVGTDYYYNASRPGDSNPAHRDAANDDYIYYDAATDTMEIGGQVAINGDFTIDSQGVNNTINYTGRAAVLVQGNADIDANILSVNPDGSITNSYPGVNCLGLMTAGDLTVGSGAQRSLMGAFYGQTQVKSTKQTHTAGAYVSEYFDMGTNVPSIYQVPSLPTYLPFGMVGAYPVYVVVERSWRELFTTG
jgi:hypothetical protein